MHQETPHVFKYRKTFGNVIALKVAHFDNEDRKFISTTPFWALTKKSKRWVMSKKLKGYEKYSEEQIFFMSAVRVSTAPFHVLCSILIEIFSFLLTELLSAKAGK